MIQRFGWILTLVKWFEDWGRLRKANQGESVYASALQKPERVQQVSMMVGGE